MKRVMGLIAASTLVVSSAAWAVAKGGPLYIKAKDVKLLKEPKAGAAAVPVKLDVGTEVKWNGASEKDKTFHEIEVQGKKGFVLMSSLSPSKPVAEVDSATGKPMSAQAFASSGAATKGLTPAGVKYAKESGQSEADAAADVVYTEELNKAKATAPNIAAKAKELGGGK